MTGLQHKQLAVFTHHISATYMTASSNTVFHVKPILATNQSSAIGLPLIAARLAS